ncbi:MAG: calcium/sodium antiporter [Bacteroidales bacterium]|jgi:cation:H+ antiporter|nr:calcium/sodium antiporter [Bacteroidales bacterium]MCI2121155.1 calcium/sodium antiporter [Bacteroidales bacterium]MCI2144744.1 calcium/sodium antiporter [Bacteroidales bacterium]
MSIWVAILILIGGIALSIWGANLLVDNAALMARRLGLSEFVIGIVIVGIGTSFPEMSVSFYSSIMNMPDMSIGNIIGSDIFNTLMILGLTSLIKPIPYKAGNIKRDVPLSIGAAVILAGMALFKKSFSRVEGAILLSAFVIYLLITLREGRKQATLEAAAAGCEVKEHMSFGQTVKISSFILAGIGMLVLGGKCFVDGASAIARACGVTEAFIAITIVAAGTSLPELVSNIVSIAKGKGQMALGNIIGSNISNILLIVGGSALIHPLSITNVTIVDFAVLLLSQAFLFTAAFMFKKNTIDRGDGIIYLCSYGAYLAWLICNL